MNIYMDALPESPYVFGKMKNVRKGAKKLAAGQG